jgi:hypothetical protein
VLAAHDVAVVVDGGSRYTPTPVISHAILRQNRAGARMRKLADGIVITPSHNPPEDGGFKYNPPTGGPADTAITAAIEERRANALLAAGHRDPAHAAEARAEPPRPRITTPGGGLHRRPLGGHRHGRDRARRRAHRRRPDGRCGGRYWEPDRERVRHRHGRGEPRVDPRFAFMPLPTADGRIRMDCSSPHAMAGLIALKDRYDVAFGNDPDVDRHGIVTPSAGLMNPNHYLAVAVDYLVRTAMAGLWRRDRQDPRLELDDRPRRADLGPPPRGGAGRLQVVRRRPGRRQRSAFAGEEARARPSCGAMAPCGPPTRTASSSACSPPRSPPAPIATPAELYT